MSGYFTSWSPASSSIPVSTNPSRKRSRDEVSEGPEDLYPKSTDTMESLSTIAASPIIEEDPIYGEGMVLLNPRTGMALSAESQTGTWYEEKAELEKNATPPLSSRSIQLQQDSSSSAIPGRKSQRLDNSAPGLDDIALSSIRERLQRSNSNDNHSRSLNNSHAAITPDEPQVDDVTCLLGISWQRIQRDDDMGPAVCGWEKYIDNHYHRQLQGAHILLKNRSLNAYLVAAQSTATIPLTADLAANSSPANFSSNFARCFSSATCFYLFQEDLNEARLVSSNWDRCLQNLRSVPVVFEGADILKASERSPERMFHEPSIPPNSVVGNGIPIARVVKESVVTPNHNVAPTPDMGMDVDL